MGRDLSSAPLSVGCGAHDQPTNAALAAWFGVHFGEPPYVIREGRLSTASGRRQTARGASNGTVLQERIRKSGGALDGTRPTRFSPVCPPRRKIVIGANSLRQDFALNLLAKRRLCNTVGGGIGRSVEDCVVSDARSRAAATTNLARSSQALVLSTLFMICPQWSAWWPADEQIVPPIPRLSYGVARPLAPTFPVEMSPSAHAQSLAHQRGRE